MKLEWITEYSNRRRKKEYEGGGRREVDCHRHSDNCHSLEKKSVPACAFPPGLPTHYYNIVYLYR